MNSLIIEGLYEIREHCEKKTGSSLLVCQFWTEVRLVKPHLLKNLINTNHMFGSESVIWSYLSLLRQIKIEL